MEVKSQNLTEKIQLRRRKKKHQYSECVGRSLVLHTGGSLRLVEVNGIFDIQGTPLTLTNRCAAYLRSALSVYL